MATVDPTDLERQGFACYLAGRDGDSVDLLSRAHAAFLDLGDLARAALSAFWIAFVLTNRSERARAGGWLTRAARLCEKAGDCVAAGYLLLPAALQQVAAGDFDGAYARFEQAVAVGRRFRDPDLTNLAIQGCGRTLLARGRITDGLALLDEAMVAATAGEVSPLVTGTIYCSVISGCFDIFDLRRAQEWTSALDAWCATQPGIVPYRGECLVHRAEIMAIHGAWPDALVEAQRACECLSQPWAKAAHATGDYVLAELHRLRGDFDAAEAAYQRVADAGRPPYPGLALLRLAQGRPAAARAAMKRCMEDARDVRARLRALPAYVDVLLAAGDFEGADAASEELSGIAHRLDQPWLHALAAYCAGAVSLARGDAGGAVNELRRATGTWLDLDAPYEIARCRALLGLCKQRLRDRDAASMELTAAARAFDALGATPDRRRVESFLARRERGVLTAREREILKLVASGRTNKGIATALDISEKTVARHLSNIFTKLDLTSRAAATAYAIRNDLA
jgi:DNA-binding CsgD family transcriptional regulator